MRTNVKHQTISVEERAREEICERFADAMLAGAFRFQVRFLRLGDVFGEVVIYVYRSHEWRKHHNSIFPAELASSLWDQMEMLSTRKYADAWVCRRSDHSDRTDFKLMFRRKVLECHLVNDLKSFLHGSLFRGHHDSGKDARRRIRFQDS